ncbi:hypothetical protein BsWGS_14388 [Bradybaena similaris]
MLLEFPACRVDSAAERLGPVLGQPGSAELSGQPSDTQLHCVSFSRFSSWNSGAVLRQYHSTDLEKWLLL